MKITYFFIFSLFLFGNFTKVSNFDKVKKHPIHVSVTNIDYNSKSKLFDISVKLFADDFSKILNSKYRTKINFENKNKNDNRYVDKYIKENLKLFLNNKNINNKKLKLTQVKYKKVENVVWLYYKYKYSENPKKVKIINTLMNDLYRDQKNLLIFTYKKTQKAFKFDKSKTTENFTIQK